MNDLTFKRREIEQVLIEKATKDELFRKSLLENTHETIENELNVKIPGSITVKVLEEGAGNFFIVLPSTGVFGEEELTEADLSRVHGGLDYTADIFCDQISISQICQ